jgi:DNA-binding transcriptional MerR regulator
MNVAGEESLFPWENDPKPAQPAVPGSAMPAAPEVPPAVPAHTRAVPGRAHGTPAESAADRADTGGAARRAERPLVKKEYYSISEVADLVGLPAHVLRYWETQFSVLNPSKNRSGNRVYQRKEIRLILLVKQLLYDEKYTVEGAKQKLEQLRRGGTLGDTTARVLDTQLVRVLRDDLKAVLRILSPDTE